MSDVDKGDQAQFSEEFCDIPTNTEHGAFICYADVLQWVSEYLTTVEHWPADSVEQWHAREDEARRRISLLCQTNDLQAFGRVLSGQVEQLSGDAWSNLYIKEMDGQPDDDLERHGARPYGEAWWKDTNDAAKLMGMAWTALSFRKADVLAAWPTFSPNTPNAALEAPTERIFKRGPKPRYDWADAKEHAFRLFTEKGEFRDWDVEWKSQAELECEVLSYIERSVGAGDGPAESTVRSYVSRWLCEWRANGGLKANI